MNFAYLIFIPYTEVFTSEKKLKNVSLKNAPYFLDLSISIYEVKNVKTIIEGVNVSLSYQVINNIVLAVDCRFTLKKTIETITIADKIKVHEKVLALILKETKYTGDLVEEYDAVIIPSSESISAQSFIEEHKYKIAKLIRSFEAYISDHEAEEVLTSQVSYTEHEATIVDWDGCIVLASSEYESDIELLKIGNYQLLRYRMLDQSLKKILGEFEQFSDKNKKSYFLKSSSSLKQTIKDQLEVHLQFESIDQSLLLIGDWYTAKLYRLIVDEFYINEWRDLIQKKLESLEKIDTIIRNHFAFDWRRFLDTLEIAGWLILLVGYFVIFFHDMGWI